MIINDKTCWLRLLQASSEVFNWDVSVFFSPGWNDVGLCSEKWGIINCNIVVHPALHKSVYLP